MKSGAGPIAWGLLLLLLGSAAADPFLPGPWRQWVLPAGAAAAITAGIWRGIIPGRIWVAGGAILGLLVLYAWNPTHQWMPDTGLRAVDHFRNMPGSASSGDTKETLGLAMAMFTAFALAFQLSLREVRRLAIVVCGGAVVMALAVWFQRTGPRSFPVYEYTGIFVNENHYGTFSNMVFPVVLALAARARFRAVQTGQPSSPAGLVLLGAAIMAVAVLMCHSRAALAVMTLLVLLQLILGQRLLRQHPFMETSPAPGARIIGWGIAFGLAACAVSALVRGWSQTGGFLREWHFRGGILLDALKAWRDSWVWGTGPGTFATIYPYYQAAAYEGRTILHVHCEPVQFLVEFGVLGGLWVILATGLALTARGRGCAHAGEIPAFVELERRAFGFGLAACGLQSLVDFPLRIPLIAVLAATWAGIWAGTRPGLAQMKGET